MQNQTAQYNASSRRRLYPEQMNMPYSNLDNEMANLALSQAAPQQSALPKQEGYMDSYGHNLPNTSRQKIDANDIPSSVAVQEADQDRWNNEPYRTFSRLAPPLASSRFVSIDEGNCSPLFARLTTFNIPTSEELLNRSGIPLGVVIQPLADLPPENEIPIEVITPSECGAVRCRRCRAYMNPSVIFIDGGRKFTCNFCACDNDVSSDYYCNLDMNGQRADLLSRPELRFGTVEYLAGKEFITNPSQPAAIILALEISTHSIQTGIIQQLAKLIKAWLFPQSGPSLFPQGAQLGIVTYDRAIHYYNFDPQQDQFRMLLVADSEEMFVPLSTGFLVNPEDSKELIIQFLDTLPTMFHDTRNIDSPIIAVVQCFTSFLEKRGGRVIFYHTSLPSFGPGALKNREDSRLYGTEKEKQLYAPQEQFYKTVASAAVLAGVCIDLNLFPSSYIDVATIGQLSSMTGGECNIYPQFHLERDGVRVYTDGMRQLSRNFGYNALMRIRTSAGLRVGDVYGNYHSPDGVDLALAGIDADKALAVTLKYDGVLQENSQSAIQIALLYTSTDGRRLIRVHTLSVLNTSNLKQIFPFADLDTTVNYLSKIAMPSCMIQDLHSVRTLLFEKCVKVLSSYRKHCATVSTPGQLILPENFKLFPLYTLGLHKCRAIRSGEVSSDLRVASMRQLNHLPISLTIPLLYPRMYALHVNESPMVRASMERMESFGCYLLENGQTMYIWIGNGLPSEFLRNVFQVKAIDELDIRMHSVPILNNPDSERVQGVIQKVFTRYQRAFSLQIVRQGMDQMEIEMLNELVEDKNRDGPSYIDFLVQVHRQINSDIRTT